MLSKSNTCFHMGRIKTKLCSSDQTLSTSHVTDFDSIGFKDRFLTILKYDQGTGSLKYGSPEGFNFTFSLEEVSFLTLFYSGYMIC